MRLWFWISGVNDSFTPNGLYSMVITPSDCGIGIGISPPARKCALLPDIAERFGCASVRTRPSRSRRSMSAFMVTSPWRNVTPRLLTVPWPAAERRRVLNRLGLPVPLMTFERKLVAVGAPVASATTPMLPWITMSQLMPSCLVTSREISTTRTRRLTWLGPVIETWLMIS